MYQRNLTSLIECSNDEDEEARLRLCTQCSKLFTRAVADKLECPKANVFVDAYGSIPTNHEEDDKFELEVLTKFMRKLGLPWKEIFWKVWASMKVYFCVECEIVFFGTELLQCFSHSDEPYFGSGANIG